MILNWIVTVVIMFLINQDTVMSFEHEENITKTNGSSTSLQTFNRDVLENDTIPPLVTITYPSYPPTISTGEIVIEGTTKDYGNGIKQVLAYIHTFPFDGDYAVKPASQPSSVSRNNWSHWSVPLVINSTGTYRVVIEATNNLGDVSYAETAINAAIPEKKYRTSGNTNAEPMIPKIAFVRPTFTEAAYQEHGFYRFYSKYGFPPLGVNITTDLDMLTVRTPPSIPELQNDYNLSRLSNLTALIPLNGTGLNDISFRGYPDPQRFWMPFIEYVERGAPNATVTVMRDEDVDDGHIFLDENFNINAYDILLLFHNEYVTQAEYDNLKHFVSNGGTIVFIDSNVFYAEVLYDKNNDTITLVKGHDWEFDGKAARRSVEERWYNETREWVGSNYLVNDIQDKVYFTNNPFNYTHFEENYLNNPKASILLNYGARFREEYPNESHRNSIIATYEMNYGRGKVIMIGIYSQLLGDNKVYLKFFDNTILPRAFATR